MLRVTTNTGTVHVQYNTVQYTILYLHHFSSEKYFHVVRPVDGRTFVLLIIYFRVSKFVSFESAEEVALRMGESIGLTKK